MTKTTLTYISKKYFNIYICIWSKTKRVGGKDVSFSMSDGSVLGRYSLGVYTDQAMGGSCRKLKVFSTLRASLSGTFLQILPELVTPLKGTAFFSARLSTDAVSVLRKVWVQNYDDGNVELYVFGCRLTC